MDEKGVKAMDAFDDKMSPKMPDIRKAIEDALSKSRLLDPPPSDVDLEKALDIAREEALADLESLRDALSHFIVSVKHLPTYTFVEKYVDNLVKALISIERMLNGQDPILEVIDSAPPKYALASILTAVYNHYHGSLDTDENKKEE